VDQLCSNPDVNVLLLAASGRNFCAGLDFTTMQDVTVRLLGAQGCPANIRRQFLAEVRAMQVCSSCLDPWPTVMHWPANRQRKSRQPTMHSKAIAEMCCFNV
jgi:enoyl-CoA hydratase/carnithine racemase